MSVFKDVLRELKPQTILEWFIDHPDLKREVGEAYDLGSGYVVLHKALVKSTPDYNFSEEQLRRYLNHRDRPHF